MPIEVRILPVAALVPAAYNPRKPLKPSSPPYAKLRAGLIEFGLVEPLVWNESSGRLVGGHARLAILKELGVVEVPVSVVRLCEAKEKALNLLLNNQEAQGRYDPAKLAEVLRDLEALPEFALTGFDAGMLRHLELEALPELAEEQETDRVEVTLIFEPEAYAAAEPTLNGWIERSGVEAHVRRRRATS